MEPSEGGWGGVSMSKAPQVARRDESISLLRLLLVPGDHSALCSPFPNFWLDKKNSSVDSRIGTMDSLADFMCFLFVSN